MNNSKQHDGGLILPRDIQKPGRRRLLLVAGGLMALSACGLADDEDYYYYLDDRNDGIEIDLPLWRVLEIRLAVNPSDGILTFLNGHAGPELDYKEGPDLVAFDDRAPERSTAFERWRFRAVEFGRNTLRFDYAPNRHAAPVRVVTFRVRVY